MATKMAPAHPPQDRLHAFAQGKVKPAEAATIEAHLAECEFCQHIVEVAPEDTLIESIGRPPVVDNFLEALGASGLMTPDEVAATVKRIPPDIRADLAELANEFIQRGRLTKFQAQMLREGSGMPLVLGDYVLLDRIGSGGMGQVFKAQHRLLERIVALKLLPPTLTSKPEVVKRFLREVRAAGQLSHPNIVAALDAREDYGLHYLVMEYVDGGDLASLVRAGGPMAVDEAVNCVLQAASGLAHAHAKGIVHRDIKPANLLLSSEGVVKILDMGLARFEQRGEGEASDANEDSGSLSSTGNMMGTIDFMAPEQALDTKRAGPAADIYSLGCTLFYLLTGRKLFELETVVKKLHAHRTAAPPSLLEVRALPAALDRVFQKMVAKRPEDRYATMTDALDAIRAAFPQGEDNFRMVQVALGGTGNRNLLKGAIDQMQSSTAAGRHVSTAAERDTDSRGATESHIDSVGTQVRETEERRRMLRGWLLAGAVALVCAALVTIAVVMNN